MEQGLSLSQALASNLGPKLQGQVGGWECGGCPWRCSIEARGQEGWGRAADTVGKGCCHARVVLEQHACIYC